jgi:hypothetical protein
MRKGGGLGHRRPGLQPASRPTKVTESAPTLNRGSARVVTKEDVMGPPDPGGFMEFGKKHSQVHLDVPGLCSSCLERYIDGREDGAKTALVGEVVDGAKTGKWVCPDGGRSYAKQFIDDTGDIRGAWAWPRVPLL